METKAEVEKLIKEVDDLNKKRILFYEKELANLTELKKVSGEKIMMYQSNIKQIEIWADNIAKMITSLKDVK